MPLPHNEGSERALLSALLKDFEWFYPQVAVHENDFYFEHHRKVFQSIVATRGDLAEAFKILHRDRLRWDDRLACWLTELWELDPTGVGIYYAAETMKRFKLRRQVILLGREYEQEAIGNYLSTEEYEELVWKLT